jgi:eukaryotic-like serine/threonine-protein kinase
VAAGTVLAGRYRLDDQLASGGMAQVWRGTDEVLRRSVAVKILHPHLAADDTFVARFRQEAIAVARLSHPAIVSVYDTCSDDGVEAIVMELVRGHTLRQRMDAGPIEAWGAAGIAAQVAGALDVAHAAGLVHRDIKPANILISEDGRVKVGDFGIAKAAESADLTQEGSFIGTAKYLAPEQVEGAPVDGRTDLYSLGVVLYEMLCGRVPFEADTSSATALARLHQDPPRPRDIRPTVPREFETICLKLLARQPEQRYASATETRVALVNAGASDTPTSTENHIVAALPPSGPQPPQPLQRPMATPLGMGPMAPPRPPIGDHTRVPSSGGVPPQRFRDTERNWLVPTLLVVLAAVSLGVAGLLLSKSGARDLLDGDGDGGNSTETTQVQAQPLTIAGVQDFDPLGNPPDEHRDEVANLTDGKGDTEWDTEWYDSQELGGLKPGVGFYVTLDQAEKIEQVNLNTPSKGWSVEIYVANSPANALEGWGQPRASKSDISAGSVTIPLDDGGVQGGAVLVWITHLGDEQTRTGQYSVAIGEVQVLGG